MNKMIFESTRVHPASGRRRAAVIVNARAGTVLEMGADDFARRIRQAFAANDYDADVACVRGREIQPRLHEALSQGYDLVLVAGGDGTLSRMLPELISARVPVGVLPLGTLNLFGTDLGLSTEIEANINAIATGVPVAVDVAALNGAPFHSISGVGYSAMMAREREKARLTLPFSKTLSFLWAAARTMLFAKPLSVDIVVDGVRQVREADGVLVTNNRFDGIPWRRAGLGSGLIEVHTFKANGLRGRLKALLAVARGTWRELDTLETTATTEVTLRRRGRRRVMVATDGEIGLVNGDLHYAIQPKALTVVAPPQHDQKA